MAPAGIEPATFQFVAQHLNHCTTAVPENKCGVPTKFTSASAENEFSKFLSNDARRNCFAPLPPPRGATKFENVFHIIKSYSVLRITNTDTKTAVQRAFCTQIYTKANRSVYLYWPLCKQPRIQPAAVQTENATQESWL